MRLFKGLIDVFVILLSIFIMILLIAVLVLGSLEILHWISFGEFFHFFQPDVKELYIMQKGAF